MLEKKEIYIIYGVKVYKKSTDTQIIEKVSKFFSRFRRIMIKGIISLRGTSKSQKEGRKKKKVIVLQGGKNCDKSQ